MEMNKKQKKTFYESLLGRMCEKTEVKEIKTFSIPKKREKVMPIGNRTKNNLCIIHTKKKSVFCEQNDVKFSAKDLYHFIRNKQT